jgi:hypothetical protein
LERLKLFQLAILKSDIECTPRQFQKLLERQDCQAVLVFWDYAQNKLKPLQVID